MTLRPGTDTGSLTNHLMSRMVVGAPEPTVGMGATFLHWTDRCPGTVIAVDGDVISVQMDKAILVKGNAFEGTDEYRFEQNKNGGTSHFRRGKDGCWTQVTKNKRTGRWNKIEGGGIVIGRREYYRDISF